MEGDHVAHASRDPDVIADVREEASISKAVMSFIVRPALLSARRRMFSLDVPEEYPTFFPLRSARDSTPWDLRPTIASPFPR